MDIRKPSTILGSFLVSGALIFGGHNHYDYQKRLFKHPKNLSQRIANFVVKEGTKSRQIDYSINHYVSSGHRYTKIFTDENMIYEIALDVLDEGGSQLKIMLAETNIYFNELKNSEDYIAKELFYGKPCMYTKQSFSDGMWNVKLDEKLDEYIFIYKPTDDGYGCFTEEDIKEYHKEKTDRKIKHPLRYKHIQDLTKEQNERYQEDFEDTLKIIAKHYKIN